MQCQGLALVRLSDLYREIQKSYVEANAEVLLVYAMVNEFSATCGSVLLKIHTEKRKSPNIFCA